MKHRTVRLNDILSEQVAERKTCVEGALHMFGLNVYCCIKTAEDFKKHFEEYKREAIADLDAIVKECVGEMDKIPKWLKKYKKNLAYQHETIRNEFRKEILKRWEARC